MSCVPARVVSVRSWLTALLGNSFSFLPLRLRQPVAAASSNARSNERFQLAGPGTVNPFPLVPDAPVLPPTANPGTVLSAESNTEAAITQRTPHCFSLSLPYPPPPVFRQVPLSSTRIGLNTEDLFLAALASIPQHVHASAILERSTEHIMELIWIQNVQTFFFLLIII